MTAMGFGKGSSCLPRLFTGSLFAGTRAGERRITMAKMRIETVRANAFAMDYFRFGQGKEPLVILPGLSVQKVMGSADWIAEAYRLLADDFTIYVMEPRNEMPSAYTVHEMARDAAEAIEVMGLGPVCLFGVSQGGMMALTIAIERPEMVRRMILGSASARVTEAQYRLLGCWMQMAKEGKAAELYLSFGEKLYPREAFEPVRAQWLEAAKTVTEEDLRRFIVMAEGMKGFDVVRDLGKISCPVLVIGSADDQVLGEDAILELAEGLKDRPGCALFMYDGYGHAAYDVAPDYRERMLRFLAEKSPS